MKESVAVLYEEVIFFAMFGKWYWYLCKQFFCTIHVKFMRLKACRCFLHNSAEST
jgi:hypothetical protein